MTYDRWKATEPALPVDENDPDEIVRLWRELESERDELMSIAKRWAALDGGSWDVDRHAANKAQLLADTQAAIAKVEGRS